MRNDSLRALVLASSILPAAWACAADAEAVKAKAQACVACHGPAGNSATGLIPTLAGQTSRYMVLQLRDFKEGRRKDPMMSPVAATLSKEDMQELADYFAAQKPAGNGFKADPARVAAGAQKANEVLCTMCHLGGRGRTRFRAWPGSSRNTSSSRCRHSAAANAPTTPAT